MQILRELLYGSISIAVFIILLTFMEGQTLGVKILASIISGIIILCVIIGVTVNIYGILEDRRNK